MLAPITGWPPCPAGVRPLRDRHRARQQKPLRKGFGKGEVSNGIKALITIPYRRNVFEELILSINSGINLNFVKEGSREIHLRFPFWEKKNKK